MYKHILITTGLLLQVCFSILRAQDVAVDTLPGRELSEVVVRAYEQGRRFRDVPAAVGLLDARALGRFSTFSPVQAVNTIPGVRMEERSPGSYRFNIRGSSLRSPFGVRNVKVYLNDLPYTQPGGVTYLNQLGFYNIQSMEIIKGPGSSLYGAGTGGVLLIEGLDETAAKGITAGYTGGSFGTHNLYGALTTGTGNNTSRISFQHQQSNGYRQQSELRRDVFSWTGLYRLSESQHLKTTFLYSDLFYETPGALTAAEFKANPKAARPGTATAPSSEGAGAAIFQKTFVAGASYQQAFSPLFENRTSLYGAFTQLRNPNIRGYDQSGEPHAGGRTVFSFRPQLGQTSLLMQAGAEWQWGISDVRTYKNNAGQPDSLRTTDDITNRQSFAFAQASLENNGWNLTAGASWNIMKVRFQRFSPQTSGQQTRAFNNELAARVALLKKWDRFSVYTSIAKGFSPPTVNELLPTGGNINLALNPETGINYDAGIRGSFRRLFVDVNAFYFRLKNTIVQRRDANGGDYYANSGRTRQQGVETNLRYTFPSYRAKDAALWLTHTWHHFRYKAFKQIDTDYSGNQMPGVAPHTVAAGLDYSRNRWTGALTYFYSAKTPLNDANTAYDEAYHLLGVRVGYEQPVRKAVSLRIFAGADNLLDEVYSLGNDINAFGNRYFNAAPGHSIYAGIAFQWAAREKKVAD